MAARTSAIPEDADKLYELPLDEFTKARGELERGLRKEGKRDEAAGVKALRKPTAPAWALNQVARTRARELNALLGAGAAVGEAQEELLGGGSRATLDRAVAKQRELVASLVRAASQIASDAGIATTAAFEDKLSGTLRAAATDEEVAEELEAGRLVKEREAVGLFGLGLPADSGGEGGAGEAKERAGGKTATGAKQAKGKGKGESTRARKGESTRAEEAAAERERERARRELEKQVKAASAAAARARRVAEAADRALEKERARAERAMVALREAEADAEAASAAADEAEALRDRLES